MYDGFRRHASIESVFHVDGKSSKSTSHRTRTAKDCCNPGRVFPAQTWMNRSMHIHQEKLSQSVLVYRCCPKLILEQGEPHERGRRFFRTEVFVSAGGNAEAMEPSAYHKAECWDDDSFTVEWRMDVFREVKALKEHKVDITSATITETSTKIVKQVSNWRPAGTSWLKLEPKAAVLTPNTTATTRTTRNTLNELSWDRAKPRSLAGGVELSSCSRGWSLPMTAKSGSRELVTRRSTRTGTRL